MFQDTAETNIGRAKKQLKFKQIGRMIISSAGPDIGSTAWGPGWVGMSRQHHIFLTHAQATAALCADLKQYAPQKALFKDLTLILLGKHTVEDFGDKDRLWIQTGKFGKMKNITWPALRHRLCTAVEGLPPDLPAMADLLSRVFKSAASVGVDEFGRQAGIWLDTGMADFHCRCCGRCCRSLDYHDQCTVADVRRWRLSGRNELIARARPVHRGGRIDHYRIWTSADGKSTRKTCPWLRSADGDRFVCSIQQDKPGICRDYPGSRKHAHMTGCAGFGE